ncbi:hypothetical protein [Streptomyces sp. NBC_01261]|uniref:hypothetical protein n=1 Tax=unclassified Streptomyces TaxID=2593676 RepID=UPI002E3555CF|nr:hypothetical protein [Streptomyces sp. NBC_01261]
MGPQLQKSRWSDIKSVTGFPLRVYSEGGGNLGDFDLGNNADEGHVEGHTYYSSNGYSY